MLRVSLKCTYFLRDLFQTTRMRAPPACDVTSSFTLSYSSLASRPCSKERKKERKRKKIKIYIRERERERERETDRQTDRHTDTQTHRQTHRQTDRLRTYNSRPGMSWFKKKQKKKQLVFQYVVHEDFAKA